ncbi:hypothetical protein [Thermosyntropha sp.]|uniref:hypothetical protein n=1 Tax=Thermosyntropha sp. TaxID=2740820 RepID=UPI0025CB9A09|nr:hypothetical protein [Thermosyntropha sp.]MBO8158941.1 hypothetical protein [Thermosyntropha sp.]
MVLLRYLDTKNLRLVVLLLVLIITSGCVRENVSMAHLALSSKDSKLDCKTMEEYLYFPEIAGIMASGEDGKLIGFLWDKNNQTNQQVSSALFRIDPTHKTATKIIDPQSGFEIISFAENDKYCVWVERNELKWRIYKKDKAANDKMIIDQGQYFKMGGTDYPSLSLYGDILVYDRELEIQPQNKTSQIIKIELDNHKKTVIQEIRGVNQYLGHPSVFLNNVVWHRGEWTSEMNGEIYLYDLTKDSIQQLTTDDPSICPVLWNGYVVWTTYEKDTPECKNIMIYELKSGNLSPITEAVPSDFVEYWGATVSDGFVTWNNNFLNSKLEVYDITAKKKYCPHSIIAQERRIFGNWLCWKNRSEGSGVYIMSLSHIRE